MDLEVVGRHALLFDDDTMASFLNSTDALVEWNSLSIDRYDVRHLLSSPPPPRSRHHHHHQHDSLESELDHDRFLDLTSLSLKQDLDTEADQEIAGGFHAVSFTYGNQYTDQKNADTESGFCPSFPVPEHLVQNLPPTEKVHQIIARTAMFVSKHGGQSEIVLRVKQGDNPTFGFLIPDHNLHPYFRFLVDHEELLKSDIDSKSVEENRVENALDQAGGPAGALSLLGSVYGSGEDEAGASTDAPAALKKDSKEAVNTDNVIISAGSEESGSSLNFAGKGKASSKYQVIPSKERDHLVRRNRSVIAVKAGTTAGVRKEGDSLGMVSSTVDKLQTSDSLSLSKVETSILEPPSDLKRVVEKIVEFILRNGEEFEAVLVQQDTKHGRFPFLLRSNQYHPFYLNALQKAQESRSYKTGFVSKKHDSLAHGTDMKTASEKSDILSSSDILYDCNRKEKFKMVIGKSKKDGPDPPSKPTPSQVGVSVDAAAAILQAATKGVKNPCLEILSKTSSINGISQGPSTESGRPSGPNSLLSQSQSSMKKLDHGEPGVSTAQTAAIAAASEADSSEASLTREQKLKAERLKRAKMFATMIKNGAAPLRSKSSSGLSAEPPESGLSTSGFEREREGSLCQLDVNNSNKVEKSEKNERRSKRRYRSRSKREGEEEEIQDHKLSRKKRSHHCSHHSRDRHKRKRKPAFSKDQDYQHRHKHNSISDDEHEHAQGSFTDSEHKQKHYSSSDYDSSGLRHGCKCSSFDSHLQRTQHGHKHYCSSDDEHRHSRHEYKHDISSDNGHRHSRHKYKRNSSLDDHHKHSRLRNKRDNSSDEHFQWSEHYHKHFSSDDEDQHQSKSAKHGKKSLWEREADLEEGEILTKSDQSKASEGGDGASREASVDFSNSYSEVRFSSRPSETTEVSDHLRAKIRAMLMATL